MIYFIDSNIFLRVAVKEDEKTYQECFDFLKLVEQKKMKAVTSHLVLAEVVWTLKSYYRLPKSKVIKVLSGVENLGIKYVDKFNSAEALKLFTKHPAKFIDCLLVSTPQISEKKWTVASYDKDFDKLGVLRSEPDNITKFAS